MAQPGQHRTLSATLWFRESEPHTETGLERCHFPSSQPLHPLAQPSPHSHTLPGGAQSHGVFFLYFFCTNEQIYVFFSYILFFLVKYFMLNYPVGISILSHTTLSYRRRCAISYYRYSYAALSRPVPRSTSAVLARCRAMRHDRPTLPPTSPCYAVLHRDAPHSLLQLGYTPLCIAFQLLSYEEVFRVFQYFPGSDSVGMIGLVHVHFHVIGAKSPGLIPGVGLLGPG